MVITVLAEGSAAEAAGEMVTTIGIPLAGLIMLVVGLTRRGRTTHMPQQGPWMHPGAGPQWPPPPPAGPYRPPAPPAGLPPSGAGPYPPPPRDPSAVPAYGPPPYSGGVPPHYPQPPLPPGAAAPVTHRRSGATALIVVGALLLIGGLLNIAGTQTRTHRAAQATPAPASAPTPKGGKNYPLEVGQCVTAANISSLTVWGAVPCDSEMSSYELAFKGDQRATCPDGERDKSVYTVLTKDDTTLCFAYNLIEGRCYIDGDTTPPAYTVASCGAPKAVKVVRRVDNSTSADQCPGQSTPVVFPSPARVYCLASP